MTTETPEQKRTRKQAGAFTPNPDLEHAGKLIDEGKITPSPETRMAVGFYRSAKAAAERLEKETRS